MNSHLRESPRGEEPQTFRINMSLPPEERYVALAQLYKDKMRAMKGIFDSLIHDLDDRIPTKPVHWLAWLLLRRLYTDEETAEIRGISRVTGIELYFLICLNVVLDLLMGCTSGGVRMMDGSRTRMVHFRTLDWSMDPLRDLIVQLEFVRDEEPGKVIATCITYVGFVGILTGVREDLSVSLNFRAVHDSRWNFGFYLNYLLVLLGLRQSITSFLRQLLIPTATIVRDGLSNTSTIDEIIAKVPAIRSTAAYLIFCDGSKTVAMEKDYRTAVIRSSNSFIITTNHDQDPSPATTEAIAKDTGYAGLRSGSDMQTMADLIDESKERQASMQSKWDRRMKQGASQRGIRNRRVTESSQSGTKALHMKKTSIEENQEPEVSITLGTALRWLWSYPIVNEDTHYAVLMDPVKGRFKYAGKFPVLSAEEEDLLWEV
ncbi:uncharacterized protein N7529_010715 [Penicillium soppii]|uniref:uncharacterized protein n=1 Tax=Penicillium soppii TaxID=69789 RepID=UPI002548E740|nr:uncharacterized protein N7529_010715 [Penicillium soppii]KAJ5851330.1 hypothetical protein N7529_010715 [Penicillium soppii]